MHAESVLGFSWDFLDEMGHWALGLGVAVAVIGGLALSSATFATGCVVAVGLDVLLVRSATHRARRELGEGRIDTVAPTVMLAGRLIAKAALLTLAIFVPAVIGFMGTVIGALTYDITLIVVGSIVAASRSMRRTYREGR